MNKPDPIFGVLMRRYLPQVKLGRHFLFRKEASRLAGAIDRSGSPFSASVSSLADLQLGSPGADASTRHSFPQSTSLTLWEIGSSKSIRGLLAATPNLERLVLIGICAKDSHRGTAIRLEKLRILRIKHSRQLDAEALAVFIMDCCPRLAEFYLETPIDGVSSESDILLGILLPRNVVQSLTPAAASLRRLYIGMHQERWDKRDHMHKHQFSSTIDANSNNSEAGQKVVSRFESQAAAVVRQGPIPPLGGIFAYLRWLTVFASLLDLGGKRGRRHVLVDTLQGCYHLEGLMIKSAHVFYLQKPY
ncbi:hypothetical protein B0H63DRAFT_443070 [Podospora didyma]|uniref:Uncharacterized protein n=1 Tax=Podospora didyma TaxID=330526 RepID=A0AAE0U703_9PEZI|nr:hypothetical protein B0H63DRAFT_443070 [Podospora didyma]